MSGVDFEADEFGEGFAEGLIYDCVLAFADLLEVLSLEVFERPAFGRVCPVLF